MTEIKKTITIEALPSAVFRALTDEKQLTDWFPNQAILEPRVGGQVEFKFQQADGAVDHTVVGKILEIIPDKKLSFSWKNTSDPDFPKTVVTWTLDAVDGKSTRVELTHTGFEKGRWLDLHDGGWSYFAGRLEEYCKNGRVEDRAMYKELGNETRKVIVVDAPPQAVFKALSDEKELTQWFPSQARMEARVGGAIEFQFVRPDGQNHMLYGRVLELVPDEKLSYTWNFAHRDQLQETVTWTLEPVGGNSNKTRVTLVHAGFEKPSQKDVESGYSYEAGWTRFIGRLEELFKKKRK